MDKKRQKKAFHFTMSVPLEVRLDPNFGFDEQLEELGKNLGYKVAWTGGGSDGNTYDYFLYVECQYRDEAERFKKGLRKAAWVWLKTNWFGKLLLREVAVSPISKVAD